MMLAFGAVGAV
jgi:hypothetical protein